MTANGWMRYAWALIVAVGAAAIIAAGWYGTKAWEGVRVEYRTKPPAPLNGGSSLSDVAARLGPTSTSIAGAEVGPPLEGATCAVYRLRDGVVLACG